MFFSDDGTAIIQDWKRYDRMIEIASRIVNMDTELSESERVTLQGFFKSSFVNDGTGRFVDLRFYSSVLRQTRHNSTSHEEVDFQMTGIHPIPSVLEVSRIHFQVQGTSELRVCHTDSISD
jgi:hypothetical protein